MNNNLAATWQSPAQVRAPDHSEIQVWRICLDQETTDESRMLFCLSAEERERAGRFHFAADRKRFVVRRAILRQLLGECLGQKPESVRLTHNTQGKPMLADSSELKFNCSHSGDLGLIALSRNREVGVDLERHKSLPEAMNLANNFFSPMEKSQLATLPPACQKSGFFDCWTRKEAFIKALGLGLSFPLNRFAVSLAPDQPAALLWLETDPDAVERWHLIALPARADYSAALAYEGKPAKIRCFQWHSDHGPRVE